MPSVVQFVDVHNPKDIACIRKIVDPDSLWLSDEEIVKISRVSCLEVNKVITRCLLGVQQKAKLKKDHATVIWARTRQMHFDAGVLSL